MFSIVVFIVIAILSYLIDVVLVGITFESLKNRFRWDISFLTKMLVLFLIFAFIDNYLWPVAIVVDATFTVRNETIAKAFDFVPNEPVVDLFGIDIVEFVTWIVEALLAGFIGGKLIGNVSVGEKTEKGSG